MAEPDRVVPHEPERCAGCGESLTGAELVGAERRQVFDLPPEIALEVCEHRAQRRRCGCCGRVSAGVFPEQVRAPARYGPQLRAYVLYLACYQHLPYERIARLLTDRYGASLSNGTLQAIVAKGAAGLEPTLEPGRLAGYRARYRQTTRRRLRAKPRTGTHRQPGRPRQGKARSFLLRLDQHEDDVLRFAHDFKVAFDNNQAERDIGMVKLQQKISGCWRTREGADAFALRSYISTARRQGQGVLAVLGDVVQGEPWLAAAGAT